MPTFGLVRHGKAARLPGVMVGAEVLHDADALARKRRQVGIAARPEHQDRAFRGQLGAFQRQGNP